MVSESAYAAAGVDTSRAESAVAGLVAVLRTIDTGRESRAVLGSGHYANVLRIDDRVDNVRNNVANEHQKRADHENPKGDRIVALQN